MTARPDTAKQRRARVRMLVKQATDLLTDDATESGEQRAADLLNTASALLAGPWQNIADAIATDIERDSKRSGRNVGWCQSCNLGDHARCVGETTLGTMLCQCDCNAERRRKASR